MKLFTLVSLLTLVACGKTDDAERSAILPIGFSTNVVEETTHAGIIRAEAITTNNLTSIGILAYLTGRTNFNSSSTPNFMYNQLVERTSNTSPWTYTPVKYWPNDPDNEISFFAYAPHNATGVSLCANTNTGYPYLTYTVPTAETNQSDLLASIPLLNKSREELSFTMKHTLAKINLSIKSEIGLKVTALSIDNIPATATLTFTDDGFNWGNYTGTKTCNATLTTGGTTVTANAADPMSLATFFLLPNKSNATFSITYIQDGDTPLEIHKNNVELPSTWTPTLYTQVYIIFFIFA